MWVSAMKKVWTSANMGFVAYFICPNVSHFAKPAPDAVAAQLVVMWDSAPHIDLMKQPPLRGFAACSLFSPPV